MNKVLSPREGPVLGIDSCTDLFEKLKFEGARLQDDWHHYDAFNFAVTAWHLYFDWLQRDKSNRPKGASAKFDKQKLPVEMVLILDVLRDLANGSKHLKFDGDSSKKRVVSETHSGETASWYAYFFHERIIGVTANDYYFSIRKLRDVTLRYFEWVFDETAQPFPGDLLWIIWRCNPANRDVNAIPPSGAIVGPDGDSEFVT